MARLSGGILGPIHGKVGSIVGAVWKQKAYVRSMPTEKVGGYRASPAQVACREKFKFVQNWLYPFYAYVTVGFRNYAKDKTEINAAFSTIYRNATVGVFPNLCTYIRVLRMVNDTFEKHEHRTNFSRQNYKSKR